MTSAKRFRDCGGERTIDAIDKSGSQAIRGEFSYDGGPAQQRADPSRASATILYAMCIIKPGSRPVNYKLVNGLPGRYDRDN